MGKIIIIEGYSLCTEMFSFQNFSSNFTGTE